MARPKLGDGDSERLQMVITKSELQAIEDWRYRNRVPSKSEAIRRLVQIGLRMDRNIGPAVLTMIHVEMAIKEALNEMVDAISKCTSDASSDEISTILSNAKNRLEELVSEQIMSRDDLIAMAKEIGPLKRVDTVIKKAIDQAEHQNLSLRQRYKRFVGAEDEKDK